MSTPSDPDPNRPREETEVTVGPIRRGSVWFEDGTIILQVERTQFQVYRGLLASSSEIFADMLAMPQPNTLDHTVDGPPVVELADSARDWEHVLKAMFQRGYVYAKTSEIPVAVVSAFLRLGKKYGFHALMADAVERLQYEFPPTLEARDAIKSSMVSLESPADYYDIVNLARETDLVSILPGALFECINHSGMFEHLMSGYEREDGTVAVISQADQERCLSAWRTLVELQRTTTYAWLNVPGTWYSDSVVYRCSDPRRGCFKKREVIAGALWHGVSFPSCDPIFQNWSANLEAHASGQCPSCAKECQRLHIAGRQSAWEKLPIVFDLPNWQTLIQLRTYGF
ncbi:hypothetical protein FIBSPDRAFT_1044958 [Athelia psychrophila]|uniref:BTB domain-containing protein n=1 Tax=Athelia psychrophila TaxID=1759441 RepID=A0A166IZ28_9AGAM|nr:hypothetical protein FIBSPDRAFT_1044958 [Fibularhizoctonia sp. CBS 109695]